MGLPQEERPANPFQAPQMQGFPQPDAARIYQTGTALPAFAFGGWPERVQTFPMTAADAASAMQRGYAGSTSTQGGDYDIEISEADFMRALGDTTFFSDLGRDSDPVPPTSLPSRSLLATGRASTWAALLASNEPVSNGSLWGGLTLPLKIKPLHSSAGCVTERQVSWERLLPFDFAGTTVASTHPAHAASASHSDFAGTTMSSTRLGHAVSASPSVFAGTSASSRSTESFPASPSAYTPASAPAPLIAAAVGPPAGPTPTPAPVSTATAVLAPAPAPAPAPVVSTMAARSPSATTKELPVFTPAHRSAAAALNTASIKPSRRRPSELAERAMSEPSLFLFRASKELSLDIGALQDKSKSRGRPTNLGLEVVPSPANSPRMRAKAPRSPLSTTFMPPAPQPSASLSGAAAQTLLKTGSSSSPAPTVHKTGSSGPPPTLLRTGSSSLALNLLKSGSSSPASNRHFLASIASPANPGPRAAVVPVASRASAPHKASDRLLPQPMALRTVHTLTRSASLPADLSAPPARYVPPHHREAQGHGSPPARRPAAEFAAPGPALRGAGTGPGPRMAGRDKGPAARAYVAVPGAPPAGPVPLAAPSMSRRILLEAIKGVISDIQQGQPRGAPIHSARSSPDLFRRA